MKVPTKHGLDRKFKPWRKGKSSNSNKRTSLKQQLRGHERLLAKILSKENDPEQKKQQDEAEGQQKTQELKDKIAGLKLEIEGKQQSMVEKKNAENSHGQRFLDRQRLTRLEKKCRKEAKQEGDEQKEPDADQLLKIALDQVYVAHHPNDVKYMPLYKSGKRVVDQSRQLFRRAVTRKRILGDLANNKVTWTGVNWISEDQYGRVPKDWTIQDEERVFGGSISRSGNKNDMKSKTEDDTRFAVASTSHDMLLKAAEQAESELLQQEEKKKDKITKNKAIKKEDSSSSSSSSSDDSDSDNEKADPLSSKSKTTISKKKEQKNDLKNNNSGSKVSKGEKKTEQKQKEDSSSSDSDSSSDDSDSDDSKTDTKTTKQKDNKDSSSDSDSSNDSDSDSDSDSSDDEKKTPTSKKNGQKSIYEDVDDIEEEEEVDDFLVDATDNHDVFEKPSETIPALSTVRGDKSRGFETQSQRPGEYKKKRIRRY